MGGKTMEHATHSPAGRLSLTHRLAPDCLQRPLVPRIIEATLLLKYMVNARYLHTAVGVQQFPPGVSNNSLRIHCAVNSLAKPLLIARTAEVSGCEGLPQFWSNYGRPLTALITVPVTLPPVVLLFGSPWWTQWRWRSPKGSVTGAIGSSACPQRACAAARGQPPLSPPHGC